MSSPCSSVALKIRVCLESSLIDISAISNNIGFVFPSITIALLALKEPIDPGLARVKSALFPTASFIVPVK